MRRPSRLALRIYLIGLAQVAALAFALWITRPAPPWHPPHPSDFDGPALGDRSGPPHPPSGQLPPGGFGPRDRPAGLAAKLVALSLVLVGISALLTATWLGRPLAALAEAARALGSGKLSTRINSRRNDELGDVATAFNDMAERIEQLVRAQRELLANVSHELRTPLSRIHVALDLAAEGNASEPGSLEGIAGDLREIERLVDDILTSARLESSSAAPPLRKERLDASALILDAAAHFRAQHPLRELLIEVTGSATLDADRVLLRRALDNLLDNAARNSEQAIKLSSSIAAGSLLIEIQDSGQGIAPEDLAQLFTPFFRADRSRARDTGGLGLGLVLVKRIVEAHGGTVAIESAKGHGTLARVTLPGR